VTTTGCAGLTDQADDGVGATLIIGACYSADASSYCDPEVMSPKWQLRVVSTSTANNDGGANSLPITYSWSGNWMVSNITPSNLAVITYTVRVYYRSEFHNVGEQVAGAAKWKILQDPQSFLNVVLLQLN